MVTANQPELLAAIATLFVQLPTPPATQAAASVSTGDAGHGRLTLRTLQRSAALNANLT